MDPALITGLAALTGALIGGLTTVAATHLSNIAAERRDKRQRAHAHIEANYEYAKRLFADFLASWTDSLIRAATNQYDYGKLADSSSKAAEIQLVFPELDDVIQALIQVRGDEDIDQAKVVRARFLREATAVLDGLRKQLV